MSVATITRKQERYLIDWSESHYLARGYHTLEHRNNIMEISRKLGGVCFRYGIVLNESVGQVAAANHDDDIGMNPQNIYGMRYGTIQQASCSEDVAGMMFAAEAERIGVPVAFIDEVVGAIDGTSPHGDLYTLEAKRLAAADIWGVGHGSYEEFVANTHKLHFEAEWRNAKKIAWEDYVPGSINYLGIFTGRNINMTPEYYDEMGRSKWHVGAVVNILRLAHETWPGMQVDGRIVGSQNNKGKDWLTSRHIELILSALKVKTMKISVPIESATLSLPDKVLDVLEIDPGSLRNPTLLREVGRVIKDSGDFKVSEAKAA